MYFLNKGDFFLSLISNKAIFMIIWSICVFVCVGLLVISCGMFLTIVTTELTFAQIFTEIEIFVLKIVSGQHDVMVLVC